MRQAFAQRHHPIDIAQLLAVGIQLQRGFVSGQPHAGRIRCIAGRRSTQTQQRIKLVCVMLLQLLHAQLQSVIGQLMCGQNQWRRPVAAATIHIRQLRQTLE